MWNRGEVGVCKQAKQEAEQSYLTVFPVPFNVQMLRESTI